MGHLKNVIMAEAWGEQGEERMNRSLVLRGSGRWANCERSLKAKAKMAKTFV